MVSFGRARAKRGESDVSNNDITHNHADDDNYAITILIRIVTLFFLSVINKGITNK